MAKAKKITAWDVADKIAALDKMDDIAVFGPIILGIMKGVPRAVFTELDEKPGLFDYMNERFYMLRRVRNDDEYGQYLFEGFK